jgi:hypothetical protein
MLSIVLGFIGEYLNRETVKNGEDVGETLLARLIDCQVAGNLLAKFFAWVKN